MSIRQDGFERLETEILGEQASALGRIGRRLEAGLAELERLRSELAAARRAAPALYERYQAVWRETRLQLWYLIVQREALGFRRNADLERVYRLPPRSPLPSD